MSVFSSDTIWLMRDMDPSLRWGDERGGRQLEAGTIWIHFQRPGLTLTRDQGSLSPER